MPEIAAFRAVRYNPGRLGTDQSHLIAPPYDVLSAADKAELLSRSDRNIVAIDLPHVPPESAGPDAVYEEAAGRLQQWLQDGTFITESQPSIYVYHQSYEYAGRQYTRKKFFARMRLEPFGTGTVFPHERTFGGPKEDRLKLMQATRCQLSAVFGLYSDPANKISGLLDPGDRAPDVTATQGGVQNRMWVVNDPGVVEAVRREMAGRSVYIADGHHRYGTALNYRDQLAAAGTLPMDHPARFVLVGFCAMEDPGALILPTHRVLSGFGSVKADQVLAALRQGIKLQPVAADLNHPEQILPADSPHDVAVYIADGDRVEAGTFTNRRVLDQLAPEQSPAWRELDLGYIHRYLIDELVTRNTLGGKPPKIQYVKLAEDTIRLARETGGIALLTKPCTMEQLRAVSHANDLMPQKSTFFYPKLATGLVINPLA
ncbi:MAG TPA: DUF1015 domain-containing protein [Phycisphaerae bacterium]|nr:DUF1015 domain-containing protein [Phycisphaerae bacterium]HOJ75528.1 DUF1015 domain-containing protein [Phycisphaerae bacterium]HOM52836.1 DUF1015 domain-containing protein [Phycisphaerae bacterium]HON68598.1 DUF1015 domain-containing protein [Phycisphaerae bacterium]HPP27951.1 DUF1015 domain-containing protein [Phycisphaerae bacterium]